MTTHLVLLRGINVSGHNMIKMDALKTSLESIGFTDVKTYIQSGNVFVTSEEDNSNKIGFDITLHISKTFGLDVPTIVLSKKDLESCMTNNPFLKKSNVDLKKLYVAFVSKTLTDNALHQLKMSNIKNDEVKIDQNRLYIQYDISPAKTRLDNRYIEKNLGVISTIRNWKTTCKLLEMFE